MGVLCLKAFSEVYEFCWEKAENVTLSGADHAVYRKESLPVLVSHSVWRQAARALGGKKFLVRAPRAARVDRSRAQSPMRLSRSWPAAAASRAKRRADRRRAWRVSVIRYYNSARRVRARLTEAGLEGSLD
ncbi:hypothetical protein FGB62_61g197 [Gracilaria domingensis]|nr:hypothetical protein FGB62_61g197 [Gracilaria domingensis]